MGNQKGSFLPPRKDHLETEPLLSILKVILGVPEKLRLKYRRHDRKRFFRLHHCLGSPPCTSQRKWQAMIPFKPRAKKAWLSLSLVLTNVLKQKQLQRQKQALQRENCAE